VKLEGDVSGPSGAQVTMKLIKHKSTKTGGSTLNAA